MDYDVFWFFFGCLLCIAAVASGSAAFCAFDEGEHKWGAAATVVCVVLAIATCFSWAASGTPECYDAQGYEVSCER